mmetsp:Transcript_21812/g.47395  ORF Transcript_21812/g.47395 Transcript_21812/m.47395 type:complete len:238 (+) Transcript_21812:527-1240(+)
MRVCRSPLLSLGIEFHPTSPCATHPNTGSRHYLSRHLHCPLHHFRLLLQPPSPTYETHQHRPTIPRALPTSNPSINYKALPNSFPTSQALPTRYTSLYISLWHDSPSPHRTTQTTTCSAPERPRAFPVLRPNESQNVDAVAASGTPPPSVPNRRNFRVLSYATLPHGRVPSPRDEGPVPHDVDGPFRFRKRCVLACLFYPLSPPYHHHQLPPHPHHHHHEPQVLPLLDPPVHPSSST